MKKGTIFAVFILAFAASAFAQSKIKTSQGSAILYRITGKNIKKPSYIFGTIHIICPNDMFGMTQLEKYLGQTDRLVLELDMDDPEAIKKMATALDMPEGKTLKDYLTPEKYAKVDEMFKNMMGIPVAMLGKYNPFGLSAIIGMSPKSTGCQIPDSYEKKLMAAASEQKKDVEGLEIVQEQIDAVNKTPIEKQAETLYKMSLDPEKSIGGFKQLLATYKLQDAGKLSQLIAKESGEDPAFANNLINQRNANWLPRIIKIVGEKPSFIAVGGGHLGGDFGVLNLLRKKGYALTPVKLP